MAKVKYRKREELMPVVKSTYKSSKIFHNGHFQTMYPYLFRKVKGVEFSRHRIELLDGDFIDVDLSDAHSPDELVILSHGLEGSSQAAYIKGMTKHFTENEKVDVIAWNMRSCSGELNRKDIFYHAAMIEDLQAVVDFAKSYKKYKKISLIGFSLGANLNAYYLGSLGNNVPSEIICSIMFSTPLCLDACVDKLHSSSMGQVYANSFIKTMKSKVRQKRKLNMLQDLDHHAIRKCRTFREFDNLVTAPLGGFKTAKEYYEFASAIHMIENIKVPTLLVQAQDDPFLIPKSFPYKLAASHNYLHLEVTPTGGHVGFIHYDKGLMFWSEQRAAEFISQYAG